MLHTAIPVHSLLESESFYQSLGFVRFAEFDQPDDGLRGVRLRNEQNEELELIEDYQPVVTARLKSPELLHIGLDVSDLDGTLTRLRALGVRVIKPVKKGVTVKRYAFIEDPNGFSIELREP